jgi:hypothetical protein
LRVMPSADQAELPAESAEEDEERRETKRAAAS